MSERRQAQFLSTINPVLWLERLGTPRHWGGMIVAGLLWVVSMPFQSLSERPAGVVVRECWAVKRGIPEVAAGERLKGKIEKVTVASSAVPATLHKARPVGFLDPAIFWTNAARAELDNAVARRPLVAGQVLVRGDIVKQSGLGLNDGVRPLTVRLPAGQALLAEEVRQAGKVWFDYYPGGKGTEEKVERFGPFSVIDVKKNGSLFSGSRYSDGCEVSITLEMSKDVVGSDPRFAEFRKQLSAPKDNLHVVLLENDHSVVNDGSGLSP